ncbi:oligosaccharide flippase family protein [Haliovirga abyssi]|uniref:Flippase n=1 Tax=Haliovirga abyssi TaxID=2996794 RepID=A0AAU9DHS3_9FUSO|nr:polysaccharide biosynthesis C-terminal domain-containing protein [Haliovirga abyssi]BDU51112.1 flippase [Haliovirga abyssi]
MPTLKRKIYWNLILSYGGLLISSFLGYLANILLARKISLKEFGDFSTIWGFLILFSIFLDLGWSSVAQRYIPKFNIRKKNGNIKEIIIVSSVSLLFNGLISLIILFFLSGLISDLLKIKNSNLFFIFFAGIIVMVLENLYKTFVKSFQDIKNVNFGEIIRGIIYLSGIFFYLNNNSNLTKLSKILFVSYFIEIIFFIKILFPKIRGEKLKLSSKRIKIYFIYGFLTIGIGFNNYILNNIDILMLSVIKDNISVANYKVAVNIFKIFVTLFSGIFVFFTPLIGELYAKRDFEILKELIEKIYLFLLAGMVPIFSTLIIYPMVYINIIYGTKYYRAYGGLSLLSFGLIFLILSYINNGILYAIGKPKEILKITIVGTIINVILNLTLIPFTGLYGAAFATSISNFFMWIYTFFVSRKELKFNVNGWKLLNFLIAGLIFIIIMVGFRMLLDWSIWIKGPISFAVALIVYSIYIFITKTITREDIKKLVKI